MMYVNARFASQAITGVQRFAIEISKQLNKMDNNFKFVAPSKVRSTDLERELDIFLFGKLTGHLWEQMELPFYLKNHGSPLLVNLGNTAPLFYNNQITVIHDLSFLRNPGWFSKKYYYYYRFIINRITQNSLKIITVSEFSKNEIIDLLGIPEDKIRVVYNAVSQELTNGDNEDFHNNYGDYILTVSSLDPRKNLLNLIKAVKGIGRNDIKLIIVGSENKIFAGNRLYTKSDPKSNIIFTDRVSDRELASLYRNAKLFIYPSYYEGFGLPPLEAMACKCPVLVSNATSLPEICGDAAYYIDPYSIESITAGINRVLTDENLKYDLIQKGLVRSSLFNWEKSAKEYLKIFREVSDN